MRLKVDGIIDHASLMEMDWDDILAELDDYAAFLREQAQAWQE